MVQCGIIVLVVAALSRGEARRGGGEVYRWGEGWPPEAAQGQCRTELELLQEGLSNQSAWAFQMMDSSALHPTGLVFGSTHQLGHYDECLDIEAPFWGKYCLARVHLDWREASHSEEGTLWNMIRKSSTVKSMNSREWLNWAACLPSPCSTAEARDVLSLHLQPLRNSLRVRDKGVTVGHVSCVTMDPKQADLNPEFEKRMTRGQLAMGAFIFGLLTLVVTASTFEEVFRRKRCSAARGRSETTLSSGHAFWERLLLAFSLGRNWRRLTRARPQREPPGPFDAVHGLKTLTMALVTVGHRNFFSLGGPMFDAQHIEDFFTRPETALIMGGTILVDTFFLVSGCLLLNGVLDQRRKAKAMAIIPIMYLRRYARLMPALMVIVAFYATLLPRLGDGPIWQCEVGKQRDNCIHNWWTNLLLIHTLIHPENMCVIQSWYVAVEFHAFLVCAPLAVLFLSRRAMATSILIAATAASLAVPFLLTAAFHLEPTLMPFISSELRNLDEFHSILYGARTAIQITMEIEENCSSSKSWVLQDLSKDRTFLRVYIPTYMRLAPYFFGMLCALAIRRANKCSLKLRKSLVMTLHLGSFLLCLLVCYSTWIFFRPDAPQSPPLAAAAFSAFARIGWSLAMAWALFAPATGHGWWIGRLMAWRPLSAFGRLTYGAFLTHAAIQLYDVSSLATPQNVTIFYLVTKVISDFFLSHFLAMILFLCIEAPVASLEKVLMGAPSVEEGRDTQTALGSMAPRTSAGAPPQRP